MVAPPSISRIAAVVVAVALVAMALGIVIPLTWTVVLPYAASGIAPRDWTWTKIAVAFVLVACVFAYLGWTAYRQFATVISDIGVTVPTLQGRRTVTWSEVTRVGTRGYELLLDAGGGPVTVNLACFPDADVVALYIQGKLAAVPAVEKSGNAV